MRKKMFIFLAMLLSGLIVLSACGSGTESEVEQEDTSAVEEEPKDEVSEETADEDGDTEETESTEDNKNDETDSESDEPEVVAENDAFRIFEPAPNTVVDNEFTVRGEARVFEGTVHYMFEDGHNILDDGFVTASAGAPEWGEFEFTINFEDVAFENGTIFIYEESAEDGSMQHESVIPVKVEK